MLKDWDGIEKVALKKRWPGAFEVPWEAAVRPVAHEEAPTNPGAGDDDEEEEEDDSDDDSNDSNDEWGRIIEVRKFVTNICHDNKNGIWLQLGHYPHTKNRGQHAVLSL